MIRALLSCLRWPIWVVELGTGAKSFADNPLIGSRRLNRLGLHRLRLRLAARMAEWRRMLLAGGVSGEDRAAFHRQGFVLWQDVLEPEQFGRMQSALLDRLWPCRDMIQGDTITRRIAVDSAMLAAVPELKALIRSPRWRGLMRYVAATRAEPHYYIQTIFSQHAVGAADPQTAIHADTFHPNMKAWLFLTDVAVEDGPFSYVPGSHRLTTQRLDWEHRRALAAPEGLDRLSARGSQRIDEAELSMLGLPRPVLFAVPANSLVVADTFGFHARSCSARPSVRVELWAYSRRNPFLPWTGFDIGSLPFIMHRRIPLAWWFQDRFPKLVRFPLPPAEPKRPGEI